MLAMRAGGQARPGVLLGSRRYEAHIPVFACGARLRIELKELLRGEEGHGAYECSIHHDQHQDHGSVCCAEAVIKVYHRLIFSRSSKGVSDHGPACSCTGASRGIGRTIAYQLVVDGRSPYIAAAAALKLMWPAMARITASSAARV